MAKRLVIDLNRCEECATCTVECAYFYRPRASDHGMLTVREAATFALVCRRCENPNCVDACRFDALERGEDGVLKRHNLRCVSCKCCTLACPFGTIYPDAVPFYVTGCDYCAEGSIPQPPCVAGCSKGAVAYREVAEGEEPDVCVVNEHLAVRGPRWDKQAV
jgi:Fe-S-cluster-containing dehydrogenase component